jgi:trimeric autotransporter adhesin
MVTRKPEGASSRLVHRLHLSPSYAVSILALSSRLRTPPPFARERRVIPERGFAATFPRPMRAARCFLPVFLAAFTSAALTSCGGDSTGPKNVGTVNVVPAQDTIPVGGTVSLSATLLDKDGHPVSGTTIFWNTENASVAAVSSNGTVTAIAPGTVRIAASAAGVSGFARITVVPELVASVRVTPTTAVLSVGQTVHLQAEPLDATGNPLPGRNVTWSSANTNVVSVDNTGLVTAVGTGATSVTATSEGKTGSAAVAVGAPTAASIAVAPTSVSATVGQTSQLTATVRDSNNAIISGAPVGWSIDHTNIASVSSNGLVTGLSAGSATITASSGNARATVPVTISAVPANAVIVSPSSATLLIGQRQQLSATVTDASGNPLTGRSINWRSSNDAVAVVGTTGLVIAVFPGTATITASSGGASGTATITVTLVPVGKVVVDPDAVALTIGQTQQLAVTLEDSAGNALSPDGRTVTWSTTNAGVVAVNTAGLATAAGSGAAVVKATSENKTGTATFTVTTVPVDHVTVSPALDTLIVGNTATLTATPQDASGNTLSGRAVSWATSNEAVAIVSSSGVVHTVASGSATITATSEGKVGAATIVVIGVPVATVAVAPTSAAIDIGATQQFTATLKDANGNTLTDRDIAWSSSNPSVATVDASTGVATAVAEGSATITATSEGQSGTATLTVNPPAVGSIIITPAHGTVARGATTTFTATISDSDTSDSHDHAVAWSSSDSAIATIASLDASTGVATGVAAGTVTITASSRSRNGAATLVVMP